MWPNNGFPHNGHLSNNLNQDEYPSSSPYSSFSAQPYQGQPFAQHPNMTPFDESGDTFMSNGFQPDIRLYDGAFLQNQYPVPVPQFLSSSSPFNTPKTAAPTPRQPTQINARAKELKAQLLKGRENRAGTSTPPVATPGKNKSSETAENTNHQNLSNPVNLNSSTNLGNSAKLGHSKSTEASPKVQASDEKEIDIEKLISEFSAPNETANASVKQDNGGTSAPASSLGSPHKSEILVSKRKPSGTSNSIKAGGRHASNGSEISEGEILESPRRTTPPKATRPPAAPKKVEVITNSNDGIPTRRGRPESPSRRSSFSKAQEPSRDDRRDDSDLRFEKRSQLDHRQERRQHAEPERQSYRRRDNRDQAEEYGRSDTNKSEQKEETRVVSRQSAPTLAQLLASDENLREWLEVTNYHNAPYRDKVLATRRKIKLLDQEREKLLAEMTMDDQPSIQVPVAAMLPPPVPTRTPTKTEDRAETVSSEVQGNRNVFNKRPHSEIQEPREDSNTGKVARTEGRARIKAENDDRRPKSDDYDSARRNSGDYREDREFWRERRERERERELSPSHRAFDSRPPARPKYEEDDRDDWPARREFVTRGGYRGRAYDPNYRGRGRGRGRGERDVREREDYGSNLGPFPREELRAAPYGATIASTKPFKDSRGFSQGGRGDTRYFIVKSFNEDNVLKCIEDSIWTTQVHVGEMLKEAFLTCKNVILVFSINKSKAFQGYARMESLPGSVEMPSWQRVINWESAGAFRVRWLCICATRFHRIGHLKNSLNENQAVLIGKDGQEIEENCGSKLLELIDEEAMQLLGSSDWEHQNERN